MDKNKLEVDAFRQKTKTVSSDSSNPKNGLTKSCITGNISARNESKYKTLYNNSEKETCAKQGVNPE